MSEVLTPKSIEQKSGANSKGRQWVLHRVEFTDGTKASTFDSKTAKFIENNYGRPVNVEIVQTEKGKDLASAWPIDGAQPATPIRVSVEKKSGDDYLRQRNPSESRHIARQAALKAAANVYSGRSGADPRSVTAMADEFIEWIFREDAGVRHIKGATNAEVEAERAAIANDKPADQVLKDVVIGMIPSAQPDAKALLRSYGLENVKDVQTRLTEHVAQLFLAANGATSQEVPF